MKIDVETIKEMMEEVMSQTIYGEDDHRSYKWFFDCGARTALYSLECAIQKEENRLMERERDYGTAT